MQPTTRPGYVIFTRRKRVNGKMKDVEAGAEINNGRQAAAQHLEWL